MSTTKLAEVQEQIQTFWSPMFMDELRESLLIGSLVNKEYQGELKAQGDTVRVSQINAPTGELRTVGTDADSFNSELLETTYVDIKADKRAVASYKMQDLVMLQSQIGAQDSQIRASLLYAVQKQINDYLYTLVSPSASAPDHILNGIADFNASQLLTVRKLAAQAKWEKSKGWWILADPSYYNDLLNATTMTSSDYIGAETPVVAGQIVQKRFGFNILEDNSRSEDFALAFHPDFLHLVMQTQPTFKISDLHAQGQFGFIMSVDIVFGGKLGIDGDLKHIKIYNT